jgi:stage II sporulation protein D
VQKTILSIFASILVVVIIIPTLLVRGCNLTVLPNHETKKEQVRVKLYDVKTNNLYDLGLEEYLIGVVAAEMPAEFELEALKAQTVAARTYAVKKIRSLGGTGSSKYPEADISSDHNLDQAWISKTEMKTKWGPIGYYNYYGKISKAVEETEGEIILYNKEIIDPVYHSTCGGSTENSEDVWSEAVPYLRSVACDYDKHSNRYSETVEFSLAEAGKMTNTDLTAVTAAANGQKLIQILEKSPSGRVKQLKFADKLFKGTDFRFSLGLRSTRFTAELKNKNLVITTRGYGHGVGMCQYGADGMAKAGKNYQEILAYYYTGIELGRV